MIEENITTGRVHEALPIIKQKLNGYMSHCARMKIGATSDPEARWRRGHAEDGWERMILIYESMHAGATRSMEKALISYAKEVNFRVKPDNIRPGGESIHDGPSTYWVYILVK